MTNRERILTTLSHRQPDRLPYHIDFTHHAWRRMADFLGDPNFLDTLGNCFTVFSTQDKKVWREVETNIWEDSFGVRWNRVIDKDIGNVCNRMIEDDNLEEYRFPDPGDPGRWENLPRTEAEKGDRFVIVNHGFSLFERAWTLHGMEELMVKMAAEPKFAHRLFDRILEYNLAIIEQACRFPIDAMMFGDDWGSQRGLLMGRRRWNEFIRSRIAEMYRAVHHHGKYVFIHSCGKVDELFEDLSEIGVDVFNPFQPEALDVYEAKRRVGDRLCFYGGISIQRTLPHASPSAVKDEVKRLLCEVGKNGGYFPSPSHAIPGDARPENIAAMLEVLQNQ